MRLLLGAAAVARRAQRLQQVDGRGFAAPPQGRTLTAGKVAHGAVDLEDQPVGQVGGGE